MKKEYTAIIIDDERLARNALKSLLLQHPQIDVVAEADCVPVAIQKIEALAPDIIFLDIQMPGESGFDLLDQIKVTAKIIFVTAYDEYAVRAFEINALDYLMKPVNPERLARTIDRLNVDDLPEPTNFRQLDYSDRLFISVNDQMQFLRINSILSISSAGDYTEILTTSGKTGLTQKSMKEWEQRLPEQHFCRIHRSTIINLEFIEKMEEWFNYAYRVFLKGVEKPFVMSRRYVAYLKKKMG